MSTTVQALFFFCFSFFFFMKTFSTIDARVSSKTSSIFSACNFNWIFKTKNSQIFLLGRWPKKYFSTTNGELWFCKVIQLRLCYDWKHYFKDNLFKVWAKVQSQRGAQLNAIHSNWINLEFHWSICTNSLLYFLISWM